VTTRGPDRQVTNAGALSCCIPSKSARTSGNLSDVPLLTPRSVRPDQSAVSIPGGEALVGTRSPIIPDDGEGPLRRVQLAPFTIGATAISNAEFRAFVAATQYVTDAERLGWSFVFWKHVSPSVGPTRGVVGAEWWRRVVGANWRDVNGPGTEAVACHPNHPVVHVSWNDARSYCAWTGGDLPTEAEWEHAARGGLQDTKFPWGDREPDDEDFLPCNIWQGRFAEVNSVRDGYDSTAPVHSFAANGYGLYNVVGNVWEWCGDAFRIRSLKGAARARLAAMKGTRLVKGGSFLCHRSYCYRYRIAARTGSSPDSTTSHQGFRVVWRNRS